MWSVSQQHQPHRGAVRGANFQVPSPPTPSESPTLGQRNSTFQISQVFQKTLTWPQPPHSGPLDPGYSTMVHGPAASALPGRHQTGSPQGPPHRPSGPGGSDPTTLREGGPHIPSLLCSHLPTWPSQYPPSHLATLEVSLCISSYREKFLPSFLLNSQTQPMLFHSNRRKPPHDKPWKADLNIYSHHKPRPSLSMLDLQLIGILNNTSQLVTSQ